jgi:hypothetical protein
MEKSQLEQFIEMCDNVVNMTKKDRILNALNNDLFAIVLVYMKYEKICVVSELPSFFADIELYHIEFENIAGEKRYAVYSSKRDALKATNVAMSKL